MKTIFSTHALCRLDDRLQIGVKELSVILDNEEYVCIGSDGKNVFHKLFYSLGDQFWFVAIQDNANGEVITILPVDYYRYEVSHDTLQKARQLALKKCQFSENKVRRDSQVFLAEELPDEPAINFQAPSVYKLSVRVVGYRGRTKVINLGSVPREKYLTITDVVNDQDVHDLLHQRLRTKKQPNEEVLCAFCSLGGGSNIELVSFVLRAPSL